MLLMCPDEAAMTVVQMSAIPRFDAARKGADATVLTHDGCTVTWGELEAFANRRARLFASAGVKAGDFVTIALTNGNEFYETTFAVWKLGATPNPVNSKLPRAEFSAIVELVKPSLVVGGDEQAVFGLNRLPAKADASSFSSEPTDEPLSPSWKAMTSSRSAERAVAWPGASPPTSPRCRSWHGLSYAMIDEFASAETRGLRARMRKNNTPPLIEDRWLVLPEAAEEIEPARLAEQIERARQQVRQT
jgi:acyl-CoA synthetase (AMP-forming)/AMP-acid ligase II